MGLGKSWILLVAILCLTFFSCFSLVPEAKATLTLRDYYIGSYDGGVMVFGSTWLGQVFTASSSYYISIVSLELDPSPGGVPDGSFVAGIRAVSASKPTGSDLSQGSILCSTISAYAWYNITMSSFLIQKDTQYAIVVRATEGNATKHICVSEDLAGTYSGGTLVESWDSGASWVTYSSEDVRFKVYGEGYSFDFAGCFDENTGLLKSASQRAVNVTAHFSDSSLDETFEVNGTYSYATSYEVQYFEFNISSTATSYEVTQYGLNCFVYNQSAYYDILLSQVEPDIYYQINCTLSWNSTYTVSNAATTGCRVTFGTVPNGASNYLNWVVYRSTGTPSERNREYWVSPSETYGATIYIFDGTFTTYDVNFFDLSGVLNQYPYVAAKRYVNGTLMIVEKRKIDANKHLIMNLINGKKYTLTVEGAATVYTFGDVQATSTTTITLTIRGIDFPKETLATYKYVRIYGLRSFASPLGTISITYQDTLNLTVSVAIYINYRNGTNAYNTTQTTASFIVTWTSADNSTDYQVTATISHQRYGVYSWKQYFGRSYTTNPWDSLGFLGTLLINFQYIIPVALILIVGGAFSMVNPYIGAILATCVAAMLTYIGWIPIPAGFLITAICFSIMLALVFKKKRMMYG